MCVGGSFGGGNAFQSNQMTVQITSMLGLEGGATKTIIGVIMALLVGAVIIMNVTVVYFYNNGVDTPQDISFEEFKELVYNNKEEVKRRATEASYDELQRNPKQLQYNPRSRDALDGKNLPQIDTRRGSRERGTDKSSDNGDLQRPGKRQSRNIRNSNSGRTEGLSDADRTDSDRDGQDGDEGTQSEDVRTSEKDVRTGDVREESSKRGDGDVQSNDGQVNGQSRDKRSLTDGKDSEANDGQSHDSGDSNSTSSRVSGPADYLAPVGSLERTGSWRETASRNLDILELIKRLREEKRQATPEEQALLVKFTGWGASEIANNLFPGISPYNRTTIRPEYAREGWRPLAQRAKDLFTPEELDTALQSTQYAHYTSETVIRGIWDALQQFGFRQGKILEPGMGVGLFAVAAPPAVMKNSRYTGVEMDNFTAEIAKHVLPQQNIIHGDYTKTKFPNDFFDVAIGNPPFAGNIRVTDDPDYKKYRFLLDYFFAKTIDKVRPGGILIFVTSKGTMDKQNK
jgi:Predicted O-methyltransferase